MKNKMILISILIAIISISFQAVMAASEPEIILYRDYEEYTGGAGFWGKTGYGTMKATAGGSFANSATAIGGQDGTGVCFTTTSWPKGSWFETLANPVYDGKLYISFDVQRKTDAELEAAADVTTEHSGYVCFNHLLDNNNDMRVYPAQCYFNHPQNEIRPCIVPVYGLPADIEENKVYKVEVMSDMKTGRLKLYVDGKLYGQTSVENVLNFHETDKDYAIYNLGINFTDGIKYFDNLAIIHYPEGTDTFSLKQLETGVDVVENALLVKFEADAKDYLDVNSTPDNSSDDKELFAPHSVIIPDLAPENFTVKNSNGEELKIKTVKNGARFGEYKIVLREEIKDTDITVTASDGLKSNTGMTINGKEINMAIEYPVVYYDYNFDNYEGGDTIPVENVKISQNSQFAFPTVNAAYGTGMDISGTTGKVLLDCTLPEVIEDGIICYSFDIMTETAKNAESLSFFNESGKRYYPLFWNAEEEIFYASSNNFEGWGNKTDNSAAFKTNTLYHVDFIIDYENKKGKSYVNGKLVRKELPLDTDANDFSMKSTRLALMENFNFIDNLRFAKINSASFYPMSTTVHDGFVEILMTEGASESSHSLSADKFQVKDKATKEAVAISEVEVTGRRVRIYSDNFEDYKTYEVTFPDSFVNICSNPLTKNTVDFTYGLEERVFEIVKIELLKEDGTEADIENLAVGDSVVVKATIKNTTGEEQKGSLLGCVYNANKLSDIKTSSFVVLADEKLAQRSVTVEVSDTKDLKIAGFVWDGFNSFKPISDYVEK